MRCNMRRITLAILCLFGLQGCDNKSTTPGNKTPTVLDQKENKPDIDRTATIRDRIIKDNFSTKADNIGIITQDGKVTLTGDVESTDEKTKVEDIAKDVAGAANVTSKLEVKRRNTLTNSLIFASQAKELTYVTHSLLYDSHTTASQRNCRTIARCRIFERRYFRFDAATRSAR